MDLIWLIPLLPGIGAAINGLFGIRFFSKRMAGVLAVSMMAGAFVLSANAFLQLLGTAERYHKVTVAHWIPPIPLETVNGIGSFEVMCCLLYTSPSPRDRSLSRMPSSA